MSLRRVALPFAELLKRRTDDAAALHHAVSSHPDVSQVAPDDAVIHDDSLKIQVEDVTCGLRKIKCFVQIFAFSGNMTLWLTVYSYFSI